MASNDIWYLYNATELLGQFSRMWILAGHRRVMHTVHSWLTHARSQFTYLSTDLTRPGGRIRTGCDTSWDRTTLCHFLLKLVINKHPRPWEEVCRPQSDLSIYSLKIYFLMVPSLQCNLVVCGLETNMHQGDPMIIKTAVMKKEEFWACNPPMKFLHLVMQGENSVL